MLKKILLVLILTSFSAHSQLTISGKMIPADDEFSWVALYQLKGAKQLFVKNTTIENGSFSFTLPNDAPIGVYRMVYKMDDKSFVDVLLNNENINFTIDPENALESLTFLTSEENKLYNTYLKESEQLQQKLTSIQLAYFRQTTKNDQTISESLYVHSLSEYLKTQQQFEENSTGKLANSFVRANQKYFSSMPFKKPQEYLNSEKNHFFDFIDFNDPALLNSTFISQNVINYIFYLNVSEDYQVQNVLYKNAVNEVITKMGENDILKSETIITLLNSFSQSENIELMDFLKENHYDKLPEVVKKPKDIKNIFDKVKLAIGRYAPDFEYLENNETKTFYQLNKAPIYILVFWSTKCSHCIAQIPQLYKYAKNKKNIHVVNVGLEEAPEAYNSYANKFTTWTNILGLNKWDNTIARKYDIISTPTYFILNSDKKIIAKPNFLKDVKTYFKEEEKTVSK